MIAKIVMFIALLVAAGFFAYMLFTKSDTNKAYIKYMLFAFPFLGIDLMPSVISFNLFDFLTIAFLIFFYQTKDYSFRTNSIYNYLFLLFIINLLLGLIFAEENTKDTATSVIQVFSLFIFIRIFALELINSSEFKNEILLLLRGLLIFSFIFLVCQFVFGPTFSFAKSENINVAGGVSIRYPSFFQDPQKYAQFLAALSFMMFMRLNKNKDSNQLSGVYLAVLSILSLLLTGGRAGLGGWLVGIFLILFLGPAKFKGQIVFAALLIGLCTFYFQEQIPIFKRAGIEESYLFRQSIWKEAIEIFEEHPFFGIGIGNYANYVSLHYPNQFWIHDNEITFYDHPESGYLKILVEQGLFGFSLLFILILYPVYTAIIVYKKTKNFENLNLVAAILSWLIGFYTVYSLGDVRIKILISTILVLAFGDSVKSINTLYFKHLFFDAKK
jgi:O-antigen ligase